MSQHSMRSALRPFRRIVSHFAARVWAVRDSVSATNVDDGPPPLNGARPGARARGRPSAAERGGGSASVSRPGRENPVDLAER